MVAAANVPVRKARAEVNSGEMKVQSRPNLIMPELDENLADARIDVAPAIDGIKTLNGSKYMRDLAFAEEPVTIRISNNSNEKNPPACVDVWVNGLGPDFMVDGKWRKSMYAAVPIGVTVTIRRKFVEQLLRSKKDNIETLHEEANVEKPRNEVKFNTGPTYSISILRDNSPAGQDWLEQIMYERS